MTSGAFARNSLASLLRTSSGAFLALVLPPVLIRRLGTDAYGVWAIGVQLGTYLALLDLGAWSVIGHFGAEVEPDDRVGHGRVVTTMLGLQAGMVLLGSLVLGILLVVVPGVYSGMPAALVPSGRVTLALLGGSALLSLLVTPLAGYFLRIHRVIQPAAITFGSRLVATVVVAAMAVKGYGVAALAVAWAGVTVAGHGLVAAAYSRLHVPVRRALLSWPLARRMLGFSGAYALWVLAGLLVAGLDTVIVARIDFGAVAAYTAAAGAVTMVAGVYGSALAPLVPLAARLARARQREELVAVFLHLVRWGGTAVVAASALLALLAEPLLDAWLGSATGAQGLRLFQVLLAANALRLLLMPYPTVLFGTGEHRRIRVSPLVEGVVNVSVSVVLGLAVGPIGVAVGTLVGAVVGVAVHLLVNLPRTASLGVGASEVVRTSLVGPVLVALPVLVVLAAEPHLSGPATAVARAAAAVATVAVAWAGALNTDDRARVRVRLRSASAPTLRR